MAATSTAKSVDAGGRRIAYWVFPARPDHFATYAPAVRIPADAILHIFEPFAAGQVRGIPWTAPIVLAANELDQLTDALLTGTKVAAMHAGFITDLNSTGGGDPYDGDEMPSLEPGTLQRLPGGTDIKFSTPQQAQQTGEFIKAQIRSLSAGLGVPAPWLDGDLTGANYSSLRAGLLPVRARIEQVQYLRLLCRRCSTRSGVRWSNTPLCWAICRTRRRSCRRFVRRMAPPGIHAG